MALHQDAVAAGGSQTRQPNSTHKVNAWHIPNGGDYVNAFVVEWFFPDKESADKIAAQYDFPPEMALTIPLNSTGDL